MSRKRAQEGEAPAVKKPRDKAESFHRLAERRLNKVVKDMERLIPLANRASYTYDQAQVNFIMSVLDATVADVKRAFEGQRKERPTLSLPSVGALSGNGSGE